MTISPESIHDIDSGVLLVGSRFNWLTIIKWSFKMEFKRKFGKILASVYLTKYDNWAISLIGETLSNQGFVYRTGVQSDWNTIYTLEWDFARRHKGIQKWIENVAAHRIPKYEAKIKKESKS